MSTYPPTIDPIDARDWLLEAINEARREALAEAKYYDAEDQNIIEGHLRALDRLQKRVRLLPDDSRTLARAAVLAEQNPTHVCGADLLPLYHVGKFEPLKQPGRWLQQWIVAAIAINA